MAIMIMYTHDLNIKDDIKPFFFGFCYNHNHNNNTICLINIPIDNLVERSTDYGRYMFYILCKCMMYL